VRSFGKEGSAGLNGTRTDCMGGYECGGIWVRSADMNVEGLGRLVLMNDVGRAAGVNATNGTK
jgi:hypothetical protein